MKNNETMRRFLQALEAPDTAPGAHLSLDELRQLAQPVTDEAGGAALQRAHLAQCGDCLAEFQDIRAFFAPAEAAEPLATPKETALAWEIFKPHLAEEDAPAPPAVVTRPRRRWWEAFRPRLGWAVAAAALLLAGASLSWALRLRNEKRELARNFDQERQHYTKRLDSTKHEKQTLARQAEQAEAEKNRLAQQADELQQQKADLEAQAEKLRQAKEAAATPAQPEIYIAQATRPPRGPSADEPPVTVNTPVYDVNSDAPGTAANNNQVALPKRAQNFVLVLNGANLAPATSYRAALINAAGRTVWRGAGLQRDSAGKFNLTISRKIAPRGAYRVRLSDNTGVVAEYTISIK